MSTGRSRPVPCHTRRLLPGPSLCGVCRRSDAAAKGLSGARTRSARLSRKRHADHERVCDAHGRSSGARLVRRVLRPVRAERATCAHPPLRRHPAAVCRLPVNQKSGRCDRSLTQMVARPIQSGRDSGAGREVSTAETQGRLEASSRELSIPGHHGVGNHPCRERDGDQPQHQHRWRHQTSDDRFTSSG